MMAKRKPKATGTKQYQEKALKNGKERKTKKGKEHMKKDKFRKREGRNMQIAGRDRGKESKSEEEEE